MPLLVLDLDETSIVTLNRQSLIHSTHTLSSQFYKSLIADHNGSLFYASFYIINSTQLANLIEHACKERYGIIILTSGLWLPSIRDVLANNLDLSINAQNILKNCYFHSAYTDSITFNYPINQIQRINKNVRLQKIIESRPELAAKYFTVVDNEPLHIAFLNANPKVKAILATTSENNMDFYKQAEKGLDECLQHEANINLTRQGLFRQRKHSQLHPIDNKSTLLLN